jgi:hypothetical protein
VGVCPVGGKTPCIPTSLHYILNLSLAEVRFLIIFKHWVLR